MSRRVHCADEERLNGQREPDESLRSFIFYPKPRLIYSGLRIRDFAVQHSAVFFDDFSRCNVVNVAGNSYLLDSHFFRFLKPECEDLIAVSLTPLTRPDIVANVSADLEQMLCKLLTNPHVPDIFSPSTSQNSVCGTYQT